VSENTFRLVKAYFKVEALGPATLKGKKKAQNTYLLLDASSVKTRFDEAIIKGLVRFVGRKNSMASLKNIWNRANEGFGQVLGIMGEPGIGKSRLLLEFKKLLAQDEAHFLEGRCLSHGDSITYLPFLEILKSYFSIEDGQNDSDMTRGIQEKIASMGDGSTPFMLPAFQQLLALKIHDASWHRIKPKERREHIFRALKSLFVRLSEDKPLVMVLDDLQWVDRASEAFLDYFIDSMSQHPILLVLLYRPEYTHPWEKKSHYSKIGLGQLKRESSVELISALLDDAAVDADLGQLILEQSAGNPLFIEEFIHTLQDNRFIEKKDGRFVLVRKFDTIEVPDTIHGFVAARIDNLDATLKQIIQTASVMGQVLEYDILQMITGMGDELKPCLDELRALEFIHEKALFPELEYTFRHNLIQEVVYNSLLLKRRIELHNRIGLAIKRFHKDKIDDFYEILAYHFTAGKNYTEAFKYLKISGKRAEDNFSHLQAFDFFEKALKIFDKLPADAAGDADKLEICTLITRPMAMLGFPKGSLKILEEGARTAKKLGDQKLLARFHNDISLLYTAKGDPL
jgi:predicted ATPase